MNKSTTVFVTGKIYWPKILGYKALVDNYERTAKEWTYEFVPDDVSFLKEHKLLDRLKDKEDGKNPDKGEYLMLKKPELDRDGNRNEPIRVYTKDGEVWDENTLLGNGTKVVAKLVIKDWGIGKKKSIYTNALRVEELVPYTSDAFGAYDRGDTGGLASEDKPARKTTKQRIQEELDDSLPF